MQQYCIKWNNHMKNFQSTLPKYFLNQKFLDCNLLVEGKHLVACHKFVLDACSDYFGSFLKNKLLDDKNLVICLPNEIKLWEIQALLQFMYHGEVCISQEGLSSLVKCAELLQVKGLCGNETTSIISKEKETSPVPPKKTKPNEEVAEETAMDCDNSNSISEMVEQEAESDGLEYNEQMIIKREINISDVENNDDSTIEKETAKSSHGMIRVKQNLFEGQEKDLKKNVNGEEASNSLVYNKKAMDIYVKPTAEADNEATSGRSTPLLVENDQEFENIVCSPTLIQYHYNNKPDHVSSQPEASANKNESLEEYDDDDDDDLYIEEEANVCSNDALYNMITQKLGGCDGFTNITGNDSELRRNLMISSVGSLSQFQGSEMMQGDQGDASNDMKMAIGGLYLRNPRGNQVRQYDVNALYSALQDVKNGHSIYRAAQTYSIPRKTLRNWMKRLHIKSQFPMPKQLKQAAERKKNSQVLQVHQVKDDPGSQIIMNAIQLS